MTKKISALVIAILLVLSIVPINAFALSSDGIIERYYTDFSTNNDGYISSRIIDSKGNEVKLDDTTSKSSAFKSASSSQAVSNPSSWDSRDHNLVTSVKNQGSFGTCWAFAFCAAAESSLIAQGYETKDSIDLSEAHLVRFRDSYVANSDIDIQKDHYVGISDTFASGGNVSYAATAVARWSGFVKEADFPYSYLRSNMEFSNDDMFKHDYDLVLSKDIPSTSKDLIKQAIRTNGAIAVSMYYSNTYILKSDDLCTYYQNTHTSSQINHGVTIVGWDDTFSSSNFKTNPGSNGAWLVKNSWGVYQNNQGYFWLSYADTSLCEFTEVVAAPTAGYDNNYQYDGILPIAAIGFSTQGGEANVFTAKGQEKVEGCSFATYDSNSYRCKLSLYVNLTDKTNPISGTLVESKTISCIGAGRYSVTFDKQYVLHENQTFSLVLMMTNTKSGGKASVPFEGDLGGYYDYDIQEGQTYYSPTGSRWFDAAGNRCGNAPLKVFTSDYVAPQDIVFIPENSDTIIDYDANIISGINPGTKDLDDSIALKDGYYSECASIGTGSDVNIFDENHNKVSTYKILIYGDNNGDGWYDGQDALIVTCLVNGMLTREQVGDLIWTACDCNHDNIVDNTDYQILVNAGVMINNVNLTDGEVASSFLTTNQYHQYTQMINQNPKTDNDTPDTNIEDEPESPNIDVPQKQTFFQKLIAFFVNIFSFLF